MRKLVSKICMIWLFIILGIGNSFFVNAEEQGRGVVSGVVSGIQEEDMDFARVVLYNSTNSYQVGISQGGAYEITGVKEDSYYLKIEVSGYKIPSPKAVIVSEGETLSENLEVTLVEGSNYYYQWKADDTYFGYEESATVPERKKVTFLDEEIYVPDSNAANKLQKKYNLLEVCQEHP